MNQIDQRKEEEAAFHNLREEARRRDPGAYEREYPNTRFYSIIRKNQQFVRDWYAERVVGKTALDYCCGTGEYPNCTPILREVVSPNVYQIGRDNHR